MLYPPKVGTWTLELATNVPGLLKAAAGETAILHVPVPVAAVTEQFQGRKIASIEVFYTIATADCTSVAFALYDVTLSPHGTICSAAAVTTTVSVALATAKLIGNNVEKVIITTPVILDGDSAYNLEASFVCAAGTVLTIHGARINLV